MEETESHPQATEDAARERGVCVMRELNQGLNFTLKATESY